MKMMGTPHLRSSMPLGSEMGVGMTAFFGEVWYCFLAGRLGREGVRVCVCVYGFLERAVG